MLIIGKKTDGTVFKLSAFTAGEHNSRVNFIAENNVEYRFEVNTNLMGTAKVIYDPNDPSNAYLFNFMNFVLEKIIFSLLAAIPSTIFVFFFLKKNEFLFIDLKRLKFRKGLKKWTDQDAEIFKHLANKPLTFSIKAFEYAYLVNSNLKSTKKLITTALQQLFIEKYIEITTKMVQVNKTDDKQKPRPFVSLGSKYSELIDFTAIEQELLQIFSSNDNFRLHEIRMKLQQKFGADFERFHHEIVTPYFEKSSFFNQNKINDQGKQLVTEISTRILFIEKHIDDLIIDSNLIELSILLRNLQNCWLLIPTEIMDKIRTAFLQRKEAIDAELISNISSGYLKITMN